MKNCFEQHKYIPDSGWRGVVPARDQACPAVL